MGPAGKASGYMSPSGLNIDEVWRAAIGPQTFGWLESTRSNVHLKVLAGNHSTLVDRPYVDALADALGNNVTGMLLRYRK